VYFRLLSTNGLLADSTAAFTYEFRVPGNNATHVVMWDYNIGIVRLASLFRLCGFNKVCILGQLASLLGEIPNNTKTGPSQTFNKNPGLQDITPNITGGAVPAQGSRDEPFCLL
jgi:hypothetical protein